MSDQRAYQYISTYAKRNGCSVEQAAKQLKLQFVSEP